MPLIETVDLCQIFDKKDILKNINLKVEQGEVFALIGPTGAGKTTLLRLLNLLDTPASGKIFIDGTDTNASTKIRLAMRRRMAIVLQKPAVFNMSVYDNVACGLKWRGTETGEIHEKVTNILAMVGLNTEINRKARTLSGGETQRVAIARALAIEPELLLLDEPTANLDPTSASRVEELITGILQRFDTTIIMTTHDMSQGQRLADRIGVMVDGEILQTGSSNDVFTAPRNREVADFVGVENIIDGKITTSEDRVVTIDTGNNTIEAISEYPSETGVSACIRPEDVTVALSKQSTSARNLFNGEITRVISMGALSRVELDCGFPLVALITSRSAQELDLKKGSRVYASFKATGIHVIRKGGK